MMDASATRYSTRARWSPRQIGKIKPLVFIVAMYPVFYWFWLGFTGGLTANPPEFLIRSSGIWALVALCLTLAVTPLRRLIKQPVLVRLRRMLGLFAFFYSCLHVLGWAYWERDGQFISMWHDIVQRPFIAIGMVAFIPMLAMALTSTQGWMRRMGRGWQRLHYVIYPIAILTVLHFWLIRAGKNNFFETYVYGGILAALLAVRLVHSVRKAFSQPQPIIRN